MDRKTTVTGLVKFCEQCDVECVACAYGVIHMNTDPNPVINATPEQCRDHNMKGHHHVLWNGSENELHPCGSDDCNRLAQLIPTWRAQEQEGHEAIRARVETRPAANQRQVGGEHYGLGEIQHWDLVVLFGWDYFQSQIIKYVMRHKKKNGLQDLEKAQHFLEKYIETIKKGSTL